MSLLFPWFSLVRNVFCLTIIHLMNKGCVGYVYRPLRQFPPRLNDFNKLVSCSLNTRGFPVVADCASYATDQSLRSEALIGRWRTIQSCNNLPLPTSSMPLRLYRLLCIGIVNPFTD